MISQGEADRILNSNPKERREMLEDALGLKAYIYKRTESERRLEKTEENMRQAEALRKEIAPHLKFLRKQVEKVNEARELRDKLTIMFREYLKREEIYLEYKQADIKGRKSVPAGQLADLNIKIAHARETLQKENAADEKSTQLLEVEQQLRHSRSRHDELSRNIGRLDGMIEYEEKQLKKREESLSRTEDIPVRLGDVEGVHSAVLGEYEPAESSDDLVYVKGAFWRAKEHLKGFIEHRKMEAGAKSLSEEDFADLNRLKRERNEVEQSLEQIKNESSRHEAEYQRVKLAIDTEKEQSRDTERALFEMMTTRNTLESQIDRIRSEEEQLARDQRRHEEELSETGFLLGRGVLDFSQVVVTKEEVMGEERDAQETRRRELERGKIRLEDLGAQGGEDVVKEYDETLERDAFLEREMADLEQSRLSLLDLITELNEKLDIEFKDGVKKINTQFSEFFRLMFGGGVAELFVVKIEKRKRKDTDLLADMVDAEDEDGEDEADEEGIDINVSLPHKKIRGLQMLSGGERALTSIALLFAISQVNPPPFMVLDETDAALDEANSRKYGDMIENLAKYSQLMVITHNRETMSRAGILYGVTMGSDAMSRVLSIAFEDASVVAK
jgi:chromosome segregation protein